MSVTQDRRVSQTCPIEKRKCIGKCKKIKPLDKDNFRMGSSGNFSTTCIVCANKKSKELYYKRRHTSLTLIAFGD